MHRELAFEALAQGWLRLWLLELDGEPAAAYYGSALRGLRVGHAGWARSALRQAERRRGPARPRRSGTRYADGVSVFCSWPEASRTSPAGSHLDDPAETRLLASSTSVRLAAVGFPRRQLLPMAPPAATESHRASRFDLGGLRVLFVWGRCRAIPIASCRYLGASTPSIAQ